MASTDEAMASSSGEKVDAATRAASPIGPARARATSWRTAVVVLAVVACALIFVPRAHGGNYPVYECYAGVSPTFPDLQASGTGDPRIGSALDCSGSQGWYGGLLYPLQASSSDIVASLWVDAPAGTRFHTVSFFSYMGPTDSFGGPARYWGGQEVTGPGGNLFHVDYQPYPNTRTEWVTRQGATRVAWSVQCAASLNGAGWCSVERSGNVGYNSIGGFYAEVLDYTSPQLSMGGSAYTNQVVGGQVGLNISATDQGSGVRAAWVDVNGTRYANPATTCPGFNASGYIVQLRPCTNLNTAVTLNTAAVPFRDGLNTVKVCVADLATMQGSTPNAVCTERILSVDNTCTDSQGAQQGTATSLSAAFEDPNGGKGRRLIVTSNQGAKMTGELHGAGGGPVAGASICLYEQIDAPAEIRQLVQVTKTRSDGGYSLQLPAGPSRTYDVFYRSNDKALTQRDLKLDSKVVPSLAVGPNSRAGASALRGHGKIRNGEAARFTGRLPGPYAAGRVVGLQALVGRGCGHRKHGRRAPAGAKRGKRCKPSKWRTFKTLRTDADGRYSGIYRFTQTVGKVRYSFRALVPDQAGYPYKSGTSDVRQIVVRG